MNILFLTDNFPPETNAPASRTYEHAKRWVRSGHEVTIITCAPNFPGGKVFGGYRNQLYKTESLDGIKVIRVWTYISANEGFVKRTMDYISFGVTAFLAGIFVSKPDVIVGTSPQFFTVMGAYALSVVKRRPFVFELRDLWPDSIAAVGAMRDSAAIRFLKKVEYYLYRHAKRIVSVTHSFRDILVTNGIEREKIAVVPNGVDLEFFVPGDKPDALVQQYQLQNKFVAAYVGTIGMAPGLKALLDAAEMLSAYSDIAILLVGTGAEQAQLIEYCKIRGLKNVIFTGSVSKTEVREYWKLADVALVLLRDTPLFAHVIPSKMFEAFGMKRPIILGVRGESAGILEKSAGGIAIPPESASDIYSAILRLYSDRDLCVSLGERGREFVSREYNRDRLAENMLNEFKTAIEN